jgi:FkbM family methyltransferase
MAGANTQILAVEPGLTQKENSRVQGRLGKIGPAVDYDSPMADPPGGVTREHVVWAYRLLLDRDPENEDVIGPKLVGSRSTRELRHHFVTSAEYCEKNPDFARTNEPTVVITELDTPAGRVRLFVDLSDHAIGLNVVRGRYEPDEIAFVRSVVREGDTVIDVGAHIGFFTMQMAAIVGPRGRVFAFEPLPANRELLERSILENRFGDRVVSEPAAVGATTGTATLTFAVETLNSGGAYVLRSGAAVLPGNVRREVPLLALDDRVFSRPVRFIKMDVEGAEPQVVAGARRLLTEDRPVILSELHPAQLARASAVSAAQFLAQMEALGYRAQTINGHAIGHPVASLMSVVFVPNPRT